MIASSTLKNPQPTVSEPRISIGSEKERQVNAIVTAVRKRGRPRKEGP
jgi:hypothetical protein